MFLCEYLNHREPCRVCDECIFADFDPDFDCPLFETKEEAIEFLSGILDKIDTILDTL